MQQIGNRIELNYLEFHKQWYPLGCFNVQQVYSWCPDFNRHNLRVWESKGYLIKLRKEYYAFSECRKIPDFNRYLANRIYRPSYISLHTALSYYGMIPEEVVQITSVTSLKTASFSNEFGEYTYSSVKSGLMFGYEPKPMADGRVILLASPEKALLDLLYLNPFYETEADMSELRLDEDFMFEDFNSEIFKEYAERIGSKALNDRVNTLLTVYGL